MNSRDYYKVTYATLDSDRSCAFDQVLDNETEFNANQFKLFDDFTTDLRMSFHPLRNYHDVRRRRPDTDDSQNGNDALTNNPSDLLENEVMVDPWSSMDSSNSPLTDSGPSASEDCTPSTSSEPPRGPLDVSSPLSPYARCADTKDAKPTTRTPRDKARSRDLTLDLELEAPRRPHFLDEDYQPPSRSNIECRIPKPHFLDHSPSPDEFDERSDITNPNFLDDEADDDNAAQKKAGALPKRPQKNPPTSYLAQDDRHRTSYRSALQYGLESAARSSERDKRASQLYRGTWPGEWTGQDSASVRSFSSNGSAEGGRASSNLENKMECVYSLISLLSLSPENNADLSGPLLEMSRSGESCVAMRQSGCIPLLVQLIHSKVARETRDRAAKALRNIILTQTDDKAGRREARVWRLLEQVREYCYVLEQVVEARKEGKEVVEDDATKHPSQSVAALMKLSFDEEHRHVVCQLGGLQALAALVSGDQAAHGSRTDDHTCLTMRKYAGMTLTNLTFGDGNNKSLLCSFKDFMMALVDQLESPNDDMRQVTAAVLRNLSWRADASSKQVLREVNAVRGLTAAAMTCQKEATLKSVLSALWNLTAHCSMNKVALCSVDGALGFLVDMLSYNSPTKTLAIVENAGGIMRNVSSHIAVREDYRQILRERNCLSVLLQHLKSPSLTVVSNSCGTLWNLSARCPQDQEFLWDHGAVPMLRSLIHSKHKMIAMGSSAALKNLLNSKPGKTHIISLDTTARSMNLPALPTLGARKQKALEQELDQNLAETCDNIEPVTSPTTSNREEKNLFTATERQMALNLERHRMTSSSPLMGALTSQVSLSHSAQLASYLSCSSSLLRGAAAVDRSDSKDSVTSTHSDSVFERVMRPGKVPVPTPRNKDLMKNDKTSEATSKLIPKDGTFPRYPSQPPVPPPRTTDIRTNYTESGYDVDQDSCDQPIDYSRKYSETKAGESDNLEKPKSDSTKKYSKKESPYGDYQETDLDQPTDYSLRYAEHHSETGSDLSEEPPGPSDTIKHFATEGTPYETPIIFSTATSMSDLRVIGKDKKPPSVKENPEVMTHSDEKDTCSIEDPPGHDNDMAATTPQAAVRPEKQEVFDTKFSSGMVSPEKPVNYCEEGTPGYFSRVSSLSSVGEPTEEDNLAKKNAMATINVDPNFEEEPNTGSGAKDKEGSKAVTFASNAESPRFVEDTPLMFSRSSSLGSLPECSHDDQGSVLSEFSRLPSGCLSPSEIPDSPGVSPRVKMEPAALADVSEPEPDPDPDPDQPQEAERPLVFVVEHTPAQFSARTSLSSLTIDDDPRQTIQLAKNILPEESRDNNSDETRDILQQNIEREQIQQRSAANEVTNSTFKAAAEGGSAVVYCTEHTPARLSAGSRSSLSALSVSSDDDLLEQCIQRGIAEVVKNKGPPSDASSTHYSRRDDVYRSLPACLRSSTETVKMSHDLARTTRESPPPLPPRRRAAAAPPRPPPPEHDAATHAGRRHESRLPVKTEQASLARNESQSSLSLDSFGSTDREIFEETVQAGLARVGPRDPHAPGLGGLRSQATEAGRPRRARRHRSLDRSDRIPQHRPKIKDPEFERSLASGAHKLKSSSQARRGERSASASSASNESFGSTDKEVFERSVRRGMAQRASCGAPEAAVAKAAATKNDTASSAAARADDADTDRPAADSLDLSECGPSACARRNELPTVDSADTTLETEDDFEVHRSNECLAPKSANTTLESDRDDLDRSNESYADVLDGSFGDGEAPPGCDAGTLTGKNKHEPEWTDIKCATDLKYTDKLVDDASKITDTWNDNTCPDDVTFPTISASVHMVSSIRSEIADPTSTLPDLLEKSEGVNMAFSHPDLTNKLERPSHDQMTEEKIDDRMLESVAEPSFASLADDGEQKFDSIISSAIEQEAARLAAQLKCSQYSGMQHSVTSLTSLDLDNVRPPSNLGSLLSLSASGQWDETSAQMSKKSQRNRKKSLPIALVKKALSNSMHHGSSEHLDSNPASFLENVKPPSEMDNLDMESSMVSVSSIVSEAEDGREKIPVVFDFKQPIQEFPMCMNIASTVFQDLDKVNPPSLFDEMAESTLEIEQTTAHEVFDDCVSNTLNVITDIPSGSEHGTPLPSDVSSVESTPKRRRDPKYLTPKEKRHVSKDRYQTYTITDTVSENDVVLEADEEFLTWTKSESDRSSDHVTAASEPKLKRKVSAKQRRLDDRARFLTQTVLAHTLPAPGLSLAHNTTRQRRRDADRFRTRTLSEDIPPSPTFVTRDANFENVETTTGYDSLSSADLDHQQLLDDDARDADSGHNEDDSELDSAQMQTYTRSFRNYLPVVESPTAVDICVVNNLKNIEMTASYRRISQSDKNQNPSSGDFASYEGDSTSEERVRSDSDPDAPRPKPKIIKPARRDDSLDSNESLDREAEVPKAVRGRKKATYVSPYRRSAAPPKTTPKPIPKLAHAARPPASPTKAHASVKTPNKTPVASKPPSANTSPKKSSVNRSPTKIAQQKAVAVPLGAKPLPLERQGTFTKEDRTVPPRDLPEPERKGSGPRAAVQPARPAHTSPSRLPQLSRYSRPAPAEAGQSKATARTPAKRQPEPAMKSSPSSHSLQSSDSGKTVTLTARSRPASSSSRAREVESKVAGLWRRAEQASGPPRLARSSTFEGAPRQPPPKQNTALGLKGSQIPSLRPKTTPARPAPPPTKKLTNSRFPRKPVT